MFSNLNSIQFHFEFLHVALICLYAGLCFGVKSHDCRDCTSKWTRNIYQDHDQNAKEKCRQSLTCICYLLELFMSFVSIGTGILNTLLLNRIERLISV